MAHFAHVLVGDQDAETAMQQVDILNKAGYKAYPVSDATSLIGLGGSRRPDAIMVGNFSNPGQVELVRQLRGGADTAHIPVLIFGCDGSAETRKAAVDLAVEDMIEGPLPENLLLARMPALARLSTLRRELSRRLATAAEFGTTVSSADHDRFAGQRYHAMVVAQTSAAEADIQTSLLDRDIDTVLSNNAYAAGDKLDDERFEACIISVAPGDDLERAIYLCSHIRHNPRLFNLPVLVVSAKGMFESEAEIYRNGATIALLDNRDLDLIGTYVELLIARQRERWSMRDPMAATITDKTGDAVLSGVYSHAFLESHLQRMVADAQAREMNLSLCTFSIQNVTDIKERYGQEAADILMQQMADWITGLLRTEDVAARTGDIQFTVALTDTDEENAKAVTQRILGILHHSDFRLTDEIMEAVQVWVQASVVTLNADDSAEGLMKRGEDSLF